MYLFYGFTTKGQVEHNTSLCLCQDLIKFLIALHNIPKRCAYPQLTAEAPDAQDSTGCVPLCLPLFPADTSLLFHNGVGSVPTRNTGDSTAFPVSIDLNPQTTEPKLWVQSHGLQPSPLHQSKAAVASNSPWAFVTENISLKPPGSSDGQPMTHSEIREVRAGKHSYPTAFLLKCFFLGGAFPQ